MPPLPLGDFDAEVVRKPIKHMHLSVRPPDGAVRITAPLRMDLETIRRFAVSKLPWIRRQRENVLAREREIPRGYDEGESHLVWGKRCQLLIKEGKGTPGVSLERGTMVLRVRPGTAQVRRQAMVEAWYRDRIKEALITLARKWEAAMGVKVKKFFVQNMKTKWGSCNPRKHTIRLNTGLARKPMQCFEYVLVHEMAHLLERSHNARFTALMDKFMPEWRQWKAELSGRAKGRK